MTHALSPAQRARIDAAHQSAVAAGQPGYMDPDTGLFVQTSVQLQRAGRCCGNGCRHCPYPAAEQARAGRPKVRDEDPA